MSKSREFPDGFIASMTSRDINASYRTFHPQVGQLVGNLLEFDGNGLLGTHTSLLDTPEIALRALKVNIGRSLPASNEVTSQVGETRLIKPEDEFVIVGGPYTNHPKPGFFTVVHRASAAGEIDPSTRIRLKCNDFADIPMSRF